jgi:hypothetical protein
MKAKQSTKRFVTVFIVVILLSVLMVILQPTSIRAGNENALYFLDIREELTYGPPLPEQIQVQLGISGNITETLDVRLKVINFVSSTGQWVATDKLISRIEPVDGYSINSSSPPYLTFDIVLNQSTTVEIGKYQGIIIAQLDSNQPITKKLTLVVGPTEKGPILYFVDTREELIYGPPLPSSIDVQLGVSGDIVAPLDVQLQAINLISSGGQSIATSKLIESISHDGSATVGPSSDRIVLFTLNLVTDPSDVASGSYTGQLIAQIGDNQPLTQKLTLIVGEKLAIVSPELVITAWGCPRIFPLPDSLEFLCFGAENRQIDTGTNRITFSAPLTGVNRLYLGTAKGNAVRKDSGERIGLRLARPVPDCLKSTPPPVCPEYRITIYGAQESGKYEGTFYLNVSEPDSSPSVPVTVLVRDTWYWPFMVFITGIYVSYRLSHYWGQGKIERAQAQKKRELTQGKAKLARNVRLYERKLEIENSDKTFKYYTIYGALKQALDGIQLTNLEKDGATFAEQQAFFFKYQHYMSDLKRLFDKLNSFLQEHENDPQFTTDPDIIYEVGVLALAGTQEPHPIKNVAELAILTDRLVKLQVLFDRFVGAYKLLHKANLVLKDVLREQGIDELKDALGRAKKRLWTADSERAMETAHDLIIIALLKADSLKGKVGGALLPRTKSADLQTADLQMADGSDSDGSGAEVGKIIIALTSPTFKATDELIIQATVMLKEALPVDSKLNMTWDFGDGEKETLTGILPTSAVSYSVKIPYRYLTPGTYELKITACGKESDPYPLKIKSQTLKELWDRLKKPKTWIPKIWGWLKQMLYKALRWGLVILSGFAIMYMNNPTFGSGQDYVLTFLWGSAADSAIKAITSITGGKNVLSAIAGLFK